MSKQYLGVKDGRLSDCPNSPNCVSTQATDPEKQMASLPFIGDLIVTKAWVKKMINDMERTAIENESETYLHATVTSKMLRFKDDVEFYFDDKAKLVHFRSASRMGYSDLGVNRKRMECFTSEYNSQHEGDK